MTPFTAPMIYAKRIRMLRSHTQPHKGATPSLNTAHKALTTKHLISAFSQTNAHIQRIRKIL